MELVDSSLLPADSPQLSLDELGERIVGMAGRLAAATSRWLVLVAEFDARQGCLRLGLASSAQWLTHACGIAHRTAVEHVRVGRALAQYPRLAVEMRAGRLSYSQVRAISRIAEPAAPGDAGEHALVDDLIEAARHGTVAQLEVLVRGLRSVDDNDKETPAQPAEYVTRSWTADSRWRLGARLDPERGAVVDAAVEAIARAEGISAADALVRLAEIALVALADADNPPRGLRGDERAAVVIHLDAAQVPAPAAPDATGERGDGATDDDAAVGVGSVPRSAERDRHRPLGRIAGGPGLPDRVIQRLVCAGRVRTVIHDGATNLFDVGRSHRLVTDRQYRALLIRQHGQCAHPGCPNTTNLHAHHRIHWLHGGRTDLDNLLLLCERHHLAHHDGVFQIHTLGSGRFRFVTADGRDLSTPTRPEPSPDTRPIEDDHPNIAPDAATSRWDGQHLDRPYAISVLAQHRQTAS
jgi:HNH endonuclease